jgi:cell division protease FtsH
MRARLRRAEGRAEAGGDRRSSAPDDPRGLEPRSNDPAADRDAIRGSVERTIIVLLHLDVLTTTHTGLTLEARESIPLLYENPEAVLLGFRDPSFEIPKVIRGVFTARREITGIPREALSKIVTQREAKSMHATEFDPYGLYKYTSGLNPVRCRKLFADLALRREAPPGKSMSQEVYQEIRKQTVSDDIELPNVDIENDIGGYGEVKTRMREELIDLVRRKGRWPRRRTSTRSSLCCPAA